MGKRPKQTFLQEDIWMANKHMKRSSTLLIIRKMQIKTKMRYHVTLVRIAIIKKSTNMLRGCGEKGMLLHYWWECKLIEPLWKKVWRFLKKLGINLPYDPAILLLGNTGHIPWENHNSKRHTYPNIHSSNIYNSQVMEAT